jgi:hypothetical protein
MNAHLTQLTTLESRQREGLLGRTSASGSSVTPFPPRESANMGAATAPSPLKPRPRRSLVEEIPGVSSGGVAAAAARPLHLRSRLLSRSRSMA